MTDLEAAAQDIGERLVNDLARAPWLSKNLSGSDWPQLRALVESALREAMRLQRERDAEIVWSFAEAIHYESADAEDVCVAIRAGGPKG